MNTPVQTDAVTRDLTWIRSALQSAIELELATLPLYLSSMFSLEVQNYSAYNAMRSVAMEEMVHMAIAANLLAAIGGSPRFATIALAYPVHGLPGGAEPDLRIGLTQYSKSQLTNFMRIETPAFLLARMDRSEHYPTIAAFYESIRTAMGNHAEAVRAAVKAGGPANQVGDDIGFSTVVYTQGVDPLEQCYAGIDEILQQGEGAKRGDIFAGNPFESEESHYARFAELYYGARYQAPLPPIVFNLQTEPLFFKGQTIGAPEVINTLAVPKDGYARILQLDPDAQAVTADLAAFDTAFSSILSTLDTVWNGPAGTSWKSLGTAVHSMVDLRVLSCFNIMRHQVPVAIVRQLGELYPDEVDFLRTYTELSSPVFYGPRFLNTSHN